MIIVNEAKTGDKKYIVTIGADDFCAYAQNETKAIEFVAKILSSDWYFSAFEVEFMAKSAHKTIADFVADADLHHCPKHNIYLPKLKIQEVSE